LNHHSCRGVSITGGGVSIAGLSKKITRYQDREEFKKLQKMLNIDYREALKQTENSLISSITKKIKSLDDYIDFLNGDWLDENKESNLKKEINVQPKIYSLGTSSSGFGFMKNETLNLSICILNLALQNNGPNVLEDFKIYLNIENVIKADSVDKNKEYMDLNKYTYNVLFKDNNKAECIPYESILVQNDSMELDPICFLTDHKETEVIISWRIVARNFSKSDKITLTVKPKVEIREYEQYVDNPEGLKQKIEIKNKFK
jgi:hypothetical protein